MVKMSPDWEHRRQLPQRVVGWEEWAVEWEAFVVATFNDQELEIEKNEYYDGPRNRSGDLNMRLRSGDIVTSGSNKKKNS